MEPTKKGIKRKSTILSYYTKTPKVQTDNLGKNDKLNEMEVVVSLAESALTPFNHNSQSMSEQHNENNKLIEPSASALPSALQTVITPTQIDIGLFIGQFEQPTSQVNSSHRYNILKNTFNPDTTFKFPGSGRRNLKFQINWLSRWKWLAYSVSCDGAFCKYRMLFCPKEVNTQKLGQLVFEKFTHEFLSVFENKQESIAVKLDSKLKLGIEKNRKMIRPIIETILLCGRQGIALRGLTDSGPIDLSSLFLSNNEGNFRVILKYVLMNSKDELKNCFENLPKNTTYISPDIQNEIINVINSLVIKKLVTKINQAKCFTILADEITDVAGIEQFSMCVRYFDKDTNKIRGFSSICTRINLNYLRGQAYDGASAMQGLFNGVQAIIKQSYPLALYIHCCSHSLNLAISDACDVKSIRNAVGIIQTVCSFFNTPKRQAVLQNSVEQIAPDSKKTKLKMLCPTRWVERHEAILVFLELFDSIIESLETISTWIDRETSSKANSILFSLKQGETLLSIHILAKVFSLSMPLSRQLQKEDIDLSISMELADNVMSAVCLLRTNAAEEFKIIYSDVEKKCESLGIMISIPRLAINQTNRLNISTESPEDYFRILIFVPFLDNFCEQLNDRFLNHKSLLKQFTCLINANEKNETEFKELLKTYSADIEADKVSAIGEFTIWHHQVKNKNPKNATEAFINCNEEISPTVHQLLKILITLTVTTASS
ncbi:52 kDa repressor of the inhibitor of the protein kinase-like [Acyrthosiphon pisum]|uniref:DUF4371 domain-containing protein n=1 Tax=Acyrthosiphon pisum TaxID=7029 RepID=A0A8R2B342_ACYPI|nr:52 kDa repressor of the inhibitor of the protein kinase-like [Acyrthosiphon pisum]|eukprot:XP_008180518.1 PREDICTED: 52 kDa repressor of the inhibitor of the protein kinase-like [Acyrthosiphon pisum]